MRTEEQNNNLRKLSKYLKSLPKDYENFGMKDFYNIGDKFRSNLIQDKDNIIPIEPCNTVACAVGHGPSAGIKEIVGEDWVDYLERVFTEDEDEFEWCFSGLWVDTDNTPAGAAKRIDIMIESGVPKWFISPITSSEKYIFKYIFYVVI